MKSKRNLTNLEVSRLLRSVSAALSLESANRFRIIAYDRAADAIEHATSEVKDLWDEGQLKELAGIGDGIASSLDELFRTGKVQHFEEILGKYPKAMFELLQVTGIGPKNAYKLCKELGITRAHSAISQLEKAAQKGRIRNLDGFGIDSESNILQSIKEFSTRSSRLLLHQATAIAESILDWLAKSPYVLEASVLGSTRRQVSTVGDIDLAASTNYPQEVLKHFTKYPQASRVLESGTISAGIILPNSHQVDLMVQPPQAFGSLLQHFTGSKHHNVALREYALKKGLSLSEKGIKIAGKIKEFSSEKDFYNFLGLDWIPPELRENSGEIELAISHKLPQLVQLSDLKGDLHVHTDFPIEPSHDLGQSTLTELIKQAQANNLQYLGLTDHNPAVAGHSKSQVLDLIKKRNEYIDSHSKNFPLLKGLEIDILPNGKLSVPDEGLDLLDYAIVSVHSSFRQSKIDATDRVLKALSHPKAKIFGHPTARLISEREGIDLDWDKVFAFCKENSKILEIDAWPNRLDLSDNLVRLAIQHNIKISIDSDSHSADHFKYLKFGVSTARRGWATPKDIINTLDFSSIIKILSN